MNESTTGSGDGASLSIGAPLGSMEGVGLLYRGEARFCFYQRMFRRRLWKRLTLSIGAPLGKGGGRVRLPGTWRNS